MQILKASKEICTQLFHLCDKLENKEYTHCSSLLLGSSIGKHMRHIIEFYDILMKGFDTGKVNYDTRIRQVEIENETKVAKIKLSSILSWMDKLSENKNLTLHFNFDPEVNTVDYVDSNLLRELAYNMEHAIHHMAIIRIALEQQYPNINVDSDFGVAYSTIRYNNNKCAR